MVISTCFLEKNLLAFIKLASAIFGPQHEKTCLRGLRTTKTQISLPRLIIAFVTLVERIISKLATSGISIFKLVSVAEETGLDHALSEIPKTGFVT